MDAPDLDALIDDYLLGNILPADKARLEQRMATDPEFAALVRDSRLAFKAIQLERNRLLKEKLKELDKVDDAKPHSTSRKTGLFFALIGIILLFILLLTAYEHPSCIAKRNLIDAGETHFSRQPDQQTIEAWSLASAAFLEGDYEKSIRDFVALAGEKETPWHYTSRWNVLMVQLAAEGPDPAWLQALEAYAEVAPAPLSTKAKSLKRKLGSRFYRILFSPMQEKFSAIKPRLI